MYNSITVEKIKLIPQIGAIDIDRLPQELTRIYAQIVSLRRQIADGTLNFQVEELKSGFDLLQKLANNLETILLTNPTHDHKESIAFVAGTANNLIYKMALSEENILNPVLEIDTVSPFIASIVLFLIGNSQADAAEMALHFPISENLDTCQKELVLSIAALATGRLQNILELKYNEDNINIDDNLQEAALNFLWRELGLGIYDIALRLTGRQVDGKLNDRFNKVVNLSVSNNEFLNQKSVFAGPYRLAVLLKILEEGIFDRAIINIPPPKTIDHILWKQFLEKLALDRPYLWENHKEAVNTSFLDIGTSAVITLPTGSGKSTLSELKIASSLISKKRVIYLTPTHALEDQVKKNLMALFSDYHPQFSEFDGEYTEIDQEEAFPILVMTPERCLTLIILNSDFFQTVGLVVFDEFHLIHGTDIRKDRRSIDAMFCLISLFTLIPQSDYLLISAMVQNGEEVRQWISSITKRECILFNSSWKPTRQLHGCLVFEDNEITSLKRTIRLEQVLGKTKFPSTRLKTNVSAVPHCFFSLKNVWETVDDQDYFRTQILDKNVLLGINNWWGLTSNRNEIAARLGIHFSSLGLKTLLFVDDPRIAIATAQKIAEGLNGKKNNYPEFIEDNNGIVNSINLELGNFEHSYFHNHDNVGIHHGLLLPIERILIEKYFKHQNGAIALVATATLAQGINLPAEIVIIAGDDRFDEDSGSRENIMPHELLNAAGRAGRAGQSSQGAVILIPGEIVTIKDSTISKRWWTLKNEVFSKGDQCLEIEDPLEYFLDSIQETADILDTTQTNILYRFKAENLSENETKLFLNNSFYKFKAAKENKMDDFDEKVKNLLKRRYELDLLSEDIIWTKEISFKTGLDPSLILDLGKAVDNENITDFISLSVIELINWFFNWLQSNPNILYRVYPKSGIISQIKKAIGLKADIEVDVHQILEKLPLLKDILCHYVQGSTLHEINDLIPNSVKIDNTPYLTKARNLIIRLIPEISVSFGLLTMVIIEKARQNGIDKRDLSWNVKALASCIREGFDDIDKLFYKRNKNLALRVETHILYKVKN
jgi:replicative superfamily II helicase